MSITWAGLMVQCTQQKDEDGEAELKRESPMESRAWYWYRWVTVCQSRAFFFLL